MFNRNANQWSCRDFYLGYYKKVSGWEDDDNDGSDVEGPQ